MTFDFHSGYVIDFYRKVGPFWCGVLVAVPILTESDGEYIYLGEFLIAVTEPSRRPYPHRKQPKASVN